MKLQRFLQKFTSCFIARDLRMLYIQTFISNTVQNIIQTNKNGEFAGHAQIKQATNSLTSGQHSKWARFSHQPGLTAFHISLSTDKNGAPPLDSLSCSSPLRSKFRIFNLLLSYICRLAAPLISGNDSWVNLIVLLQEVWLGFTVIPSGPKYPKRQ